MAPPPSGHVFFRYHHELKKLTSLSISKNDECPPKARCSEYFDEILDPFSSCMLMELLEQTVKNQKIALNFQTAVLVILPL